jgi:hypothetical protein
VFSSFLPSFISFSSLFHAFPSHQKSI